MTMHLARFISKKQIEQSEASKLNNATTQASSKLISSVGMLNVREIQECMYWRAGC